MRKGILTIFLASFLIAFTIHPALASYSPCAAGLGDPLYPNLGNACYQVEHYDLNLRFDPATGLLRGEALLDIVLTNSVTDGFAVDLTSDMAIQAVTLDGSTVGYSRPTTDDVSIGLIGGYIPPGTKYRLGITYSGYPLDHVAPPTQVEYSPGWMRTPEGVVVISEPDGAHRWFPANNYPTDKATFSIKVTVPAGVGVVSNGWPKPTTIGDDRWETTEWVQSDPMAPYLATLAIGDYTIDKGATPLGRPLLNAFAPGTRQTTEELDRIDDYVTFLQGRLGPYPYASIGAIVTGAAGWGALETQNRPTFASDVFTDPTLGAPVVVHELAHQWLGNAKPVATWEHIWLNEGFATFLQWLWIEHEGGSTTAQELHVTACDPTSWGNRPIASPSWSTMFDWPVYQRGAMTLAALRQRMGDIAFFALLREWAADPRPARTSDFEAMASQAAGEDMKSFFDPWIRGGAKILGICDPPPPVTNVAFTQDDTSQRLGVTWQPPTAAGNDPILGYTAKIWSMTAGQYVAEVELPLDARSWVSNPLDPKGIYQIAIGARNRAGFTPTVSAWIKFPPSAPTLLSTVPGIKGGALTAMVSWAAPSTSGYANISGYRIYATLYDSKGRVIETSTTTVSDPGQQSAEVTVSKNGSYRFAVSALSSVGEGPRSAPSALVKPR